MPSIDDLEKLTDVADMGRGEYRDCWAWVHFMLHGPAEARHELIRFLADVQASAPPGTMSERLARCFSNPRSRLGEHFKTWKRPPGSNPER